DQAEKQPDTNPRKIIIECQKNVSEEIAANLPSYSSSRQLFDPSKKNNDRIIIFATEKNLQLLSQYHHWLCDGTFDAAPILFTQLFTIIINGKNVPLAYALASCDFEKAIINSSEEVFPDAEIFGCFFHLKKNIWRHIQEDGLSVKYCESKIEENTVRLYSKMLACLAFVPVEDTVAYFEDFYIGPMSRGRNHKRKSPLFDIDMWSCHKRTVLGLPRTKNNLEGWHYALQSSIKTHSHLLSFINSIKLEQSNSENFYAHLCSGLANKRKECYVALEDKINQSITNYNKENVSNFLKYLSFLIEFK
ncbi:unnamed protein product, partial [Brachionus calyciflorus]